MCVILWPVAQLTFQRAAPRRTSADVRRPGRSRTFTGRRNRRRVGHADRRRRPRGIHYSAVRRYFSSHKEVLMHLAAEGWVRFSETVCAELGESGPKSPAQVAETLASALAADTLFCDLLANLHLHLEHEVHIDRVVEIRRTISAAAVEVANATQRALPALGRSGAFDILIAAYSLAAAFWQIANRRSAYRCLCNEPEVVPPEWNIDFASALTRLLTATCIGLVAESP